MGHPVEFVEESDTGTVGSDSDNASRDNSSNSYGSGSESGCGRSTEEESSPWVLFIPARLGNE